MSLTPISDMVQVTKSAFAAPASMFSGDTMFKNPFGDAASALSDATDSLSVLSDAVPGFDLTSITSVATSAMTDMTTHAQDTIKNLPMHLPLAIAAAQQTVAIKTMDAVISNLTPPSFSSTCSLFDALGMTNPFGAISGAARDLINGAVDGIHGAFDSIMGTVGPLVSSLVGSTISTGQQLFDAIKAAGSSLKASITTALSAVSSTIQGALSSITSSIQSFKDSITDMIANEVAAIKDAINTVLSTSLFNLLGSTNPCIASIMGNIVDTSKINQSALNVYHESVGNLIT